MAPDRGSPSRRSPDHPVASSSAALLRTQQAQFIAAQSSVPQNFTFRGILVGLGVGAIICFSNTYFGLQTGWVSSMSMPSSLIGFAFFKTLGGHLGGWGTDALKFTEVENVLIQTVAGSMGTMPLGCGFVGVIPAMQFLMGSEDFGAQGNGGVAVVGLGKGKGKGLDLSLWKLILWALGLCFFGVVFAVPLRRQVIIREKLKFPSGTATALMIGVLHGKTDRVVKDGVEDEESEALLIRGDSGASENSQQGVPTEEDLELDDEESLGVDQRNDWKAKVKLLVIAFSVSAVFSLATYFIPILRSLPVFGSYVASTWLWTLNPSLAYVGQGIIMGPATTMHMLLGAVVGWGILSPLAKYRGWAPGPVEDWEQGSKGWIVWISLAIMLVDSIISLGYIALQPIARQGQQYLPDFRSKVSQKDWKGLLHLTKTPSNSKISYAPLPSSEASLTEQTTSLSPEAKDLPEPDAPPEHLVNTSTVTIGLILSLAFCILSIRVVFGALIPFYAIILAVFMALLLSIMGVRALGETDLNPVSGISKLAQLFFALIVPSSNPNTILINLIAGAVSEAGALQAGDLLQDLKTGHLLGAAPNAQFWGQIIGSAVGAVVSAGIYKLYVGVYEVPGDLFQVPTGYVWIFTARLVTGKGLPDMAFEWALGAAAIFAFTTLVRIAGAGKRWHPWVPGGIAVAVGMYNIPSFTLARTIGGLINWYWTSYRQQTETSIVILASGLILGEGVVSIVNLLLAGFGVPHL